MKIAYTNCESGFKKQEFQILKKGLDSKLTFELKPILVEKKLLFTNYVKYLYETKKSWQHKFDILLIRILLKSIKG